MKSGLRIRILAVLVIVLCFGLPAASAQLPEPAAAPPPPTNVSASDGAYSTKIQITWYPSAGANGYRVFRSDTVDGNKTSLANTTATEYSDYEPGPVQVRYYWVIACVDNANCSGYSNSDSGFRGLATPTVYASDGTYTDKVRITWNIVQGATSYTLYRGTTSAGYDVAVANITNTYYDNTSAVPGTMYYYWVRAFSTSPADQSGDGEDTGYRQYPPPMGVSATDGLWTDRVVVTWNAVAGTGRYQVWRVPAAGGTAVRVALTTDTVAHDTLATPGASYEYRVWACTADDTICGAYATDLGYRKLTPPTGVAASDGTYTDKVRVSWAAHPYATFYKVRRGLTAGHYSETFPDVAASPYDDATAERGVQYYYIVQACTAAGCSDFTAYDGGYRNFAAPTGVAASDGTFPDKVRVTWNASTGAAYYRIERATSPTGAKTIIAGPAATSYDDTSASVGTFYYYWISACNAQFCSAPSVGDMGYRTQATPTPTATLTSTRTPTITPTPTRTATPRPTNTPGPTPTRVPGLQRRVFLPLVMK